ncbi:hypothetical protein KIPB_012704 [Kipferlia bialata]|uniref:DUF1353 domain-containing protein n=1 Tax=Kipferlia bialata TaxID=797122 RepID=A0A9K3GP03_9EUKA|nr:hypothetical protein KIPB_012704 [Kipferlia bialata]|eukprot:g12704.t1
MADDQYRQDGNVYIVEHLRGPNRKGIYTVDNPIDLRIVIPKVSFGDLGTYGVSLELKIQKGFKTDLMSGPFFWLDKKYALAWFTHDILYCWRQDTPYPNAPPGWDKKRAADAIMRSLLPPVLGAVAQKGVELMGKGAWDTQQSNLNNQRRSVCPIVTLLSVARPPPTQPTGFKPHETPINVIPSQMPQFQSDQK